MASKITPAKSKKPAAKAAVSTPVRNSAIPKVAAKKTLDITFEMIARKAFEIHASGKGGSEQDNWFAAERELRGSI
jgi:hypothetical protein